MPRVEVEVGRGWGDWEEISRGLAVCGEMCPGIAPDEEQRVQTPLWLLKTPTVPGRPRHTSGFGSTPSRTLPVPCYGVSGRMRYARPPLWDWPNLP